MKMIECKQVEVFFGNDREMAMYFDIYKIQPTNKMLEMLDKAYPGFMLDRTKIKIHNALGYDESIKVTMILSKEQAV